MISSSRSISLSSAMFWKTMTGVDEGSPLSVVGTFVTVGFAVGNRW